MGFIACLKRFLLKSFFFVFFFAVITPMHTASASDTIIVSDSLFPSVTFYGVTARKTGYLKANERVKILYSIDQWYYIVIKNNNEYRVGWSDLYPEWNAVPTVPAVSDSQIEVFINSKNIESRTDYLVWTDLARYRTYIFIKENGVWKLVKKADCAIGDPQHPTPKGLFEVIFKTPYIGDENEWYICKSAVCFYKSFMFHSVPFVWTGKYITDNRTTGAISHGCLRFSAVDSKWIYDNIPETTKVWIN